MSNEATVRTGIQIIVGGLIYRPPTASFNVDVSAARGPTPGLVVVPILGIDVDLSGLTTPGLCRISNYDTTNFITYGIGDAVTNEFYPLGEVGPEESYILKLSRNLGSDLDSLTTGTGSGTKTLRLVADTAVCNCSVEAFEK